MAAVIKFVAFSVKQLKILTWWTAVSPYQNWNGIIADGAIRAGKTVPMAMSYVFWAMDTFSGQNFAMCGKSIGAFKRNVWQWLKPALQKRGYHIIEVRSTNFITISFRGKTNYFYIFGGKDESSQDLIQGITLAGIYFDEVALQPESFVLQGTGRCSVKGAKFWFNCNPEGPEHWFKKDWIDKVAEKKLLHIHFSMDDNPSLDDDTKARYKSMYSGVFFQRFILGLWVIAKGAIYDMFGAANTYSDGSGPNYALWYRRYFVIDYGTVNPFVILEVIEQDKKYYVENEWYYDSKAHNRQKDDNEYTDDLIKFIDNRRYGSVIIDPSAASFKAAARNKGVRFRDADNDVLDGIHLTASLFSLSILKINKDKCPTLIAEIASYIWDEKASERGEEKPVKVFDHAVDALRYAVKTIVRYIPMDKKF
jgi:PBSX family phage terminase large subunit